MVDCPRSLGGLFAVQKCSLTHKTHLCINSPPMVWGLSAGRGLSAKSTRTVRIWTETKISNSREHLPKVVTGSPKRLELLRQDLGEKICVTRWCYAPKFLVSNSLQRRESRITRTQPWTNNSTQRSSNRGGFPTFDGSRSSTKRHRHSPMIPSKKSEEKPSQIRGINRRTKTPKRQQKDPQKSLLRIFYTTKKDSYKV
jgi:hypothetical protein